MCRLSRSVPSSLFSLHCPLHTHSFLKLHQFHEKFIPSILYVFFFLLFSFLLLLGLSLTSLFLLYTRVLLLFLLFLSNFILGKFDCILCHCYFHFSWVWWSILVFFFGRGDHSIYNIFRLSICY